MPNTEIRLAVLETAEWYREDRMTTARPLFQLLTQHIYGDPNWFHYATFTGPESFKETLYDLVHKRGVKYVYICTHGEDGKIQFASKNKTHPYDKTIVKCLEKTSLRGVLFGGCELASLASDLSEGLKEKTLEEKGRLQESPWFAGYTESIDWMEASFLDLAFLRLVLGAQEHDDQKMRAEFKLAVKARYHMAYALHLLDEDGFEAIRKRLGFSVYINGKEVEPSGDEAETE